MRSKVIDMDFLKNETVRHKRNYRQSRNRAVKRHELYYANLDPVQGSEQGGTRPVLIIQNDIGNRFSTTTIVCMITKKTPKNILPTHVKLGREFGLKQDSYVLCEQIRTIDKNRILDFIGEIDSEEKQLELDQALMKSLQLMMA